MLWLLPVNCQLSFVVFGNKAPPCHPRKGCCKTTTTPWRIQKQPPLARKVHHFGCITPDWTWRLKMAPMACTSPPPSLPMPPWVGGCCGSTGKGSCSTTALAAAECQLLMDSVVQMAAGFDRIDPRMPTSPCPLPLWSLHKRIQSRHLQHGKAEIMAKEPLSCSVVVQGV